MNTCPICQAPYSGKANCHRCGTDLEALIRIRETTSFHFESALSCYQEGAYDQMYDHAKKAVSKYRSPAALKLLSLAALLTSRFDMALSLWKQLNSF